MRARRRLSSWRERYPRHNELIDARVLKSAATAASSSRKGGRLSKWRYAGNCPISSSIRGASIAISVAGGDVNKNAGIGGGHVSVILRHRSRRGRKLPARVVARSCPSMTLSKAVAEMEIHRVARRRHLTMRGGTAMRNVMSHGINMRISNSTPKTAEIMPSP